MKLVNVCVALMAATTVSSLSTRQSPYLAAREHENQPSDEATKEIMNAVAEAAKNAAAAKGKEIIDKEKGIVVEKGKEIAESAKAAAKAKAEASLRHSKQVAQEIFDSFKGYSLMKIKEIATQLLELIKKKIADAVDFGKEKTGEVIDKKKEEFKNKLENGKLVGKVGNYSIALSARELDEFQLAERAFLDDAMVHIFVLLKRSGLINSIIRQSLSDEDVREAIAKITIELIDADVIPYAEVFEALKDSGLALDVVKFSLTDPETRSGLVQLIVELIPELFRSGVLNPLDYIGGPNVSARDTSISASTLRTMPAVPTY
uniref:Uncharacterized protein n=1 Tax=Candidozyma auris TaxID=498019 RepID=A0A0L0NVI3_CANAR